MICWLIRRRLLRFSPAELASLPKGSVQHHLRRCPGCERLREVYLALNKDLASGATPETHRLLPIKLNLTINNTMSRNAETSIWRKLDWWLMPEKSAKWAFSILTIIVVAGFGYRQLPVEQVGQAGFPNNLVITRGHVLVTVEPEKGLHLSNTSIIPDHGSAHGNPDDSQKEAI